MAEKIACGYFFIAPQQKTIYLEGPVSRRCAATETHGKKTASASLRLLFIVHFLGHKKKSCFAPMTGVVSRGKTALPQGFFIALLRPWLKEEPHGRKK